MIARVRTLDATDAARGADLDALIERTAELALGYLRSLPDRPVRVDQDVESLRRSLVIPLTEDGEDALAVIEALARGADPGIVAMAGPRYFGFVIGGSLPVAVAADWLTTTWDQNAGLYVCGPAASVVEEAVGAWLIELFGLPRASSYGLTTGCQMAHFTCLAAARHAVLARVGWDVEARGLFGAPEVHVIVGAEAHATVGGALQYLGMGRDRVTVVAADEQGRMRVESLREAMAAVPRNAPTIVCLQAGNVNTGAFDPLGPLIAIARERDGAWVHVDGAFGLWAAASPRTRHLVAGVERADSWATDAHKWLNVPYDSGLAFVANAEHHAAALTPPHATYLEYSPTRDQVHWSPEYSRRARGFTVYAALRHLGRAGVRSLVERCCNIARLMADGLARDARVRILNDVVLNQVLVGFVPADGGDADELTRAVVKRVQEDGVLWLSGTTWHGMAAMRISVSNWSTTVADAERSVAAILSALDSLARR